MISRQIAVSNFITGCKGWFREKYILLKERKLILFGNAAKCEMMIRVLDEIGLRENIVAITCNGLEKLGGGNYRAAIPMIPPEDAFKIEHSIFIICSKYVREIADQLEKSGKEYIISDRFDEWIERVLISDVYCTVPKEHVADAYSWIQEFDNKKTNV